MRDGRLLPGLHRPGSQLESLENQKRFFEDFAEKQGHQLVKIYADEGISE